MDIEIDIYIVQDSFTMVIEEVYFDEEDARKHCTIREELEYKQFSVKE